MESLIVKTAQVCLLPFIKQPLTLTRIFSPMIAVGSDETSGTGGGKVKVYEYSEMARRWQVKEV